MKRVRLYLIGVLIFLSGSTSGFAQTNAESFYYSGCSAFNAQSYGAALTNFTSSVKLNPLNADAYNMLGATKWWLQDYNGAIVDYDKAIALNPKSGCYYCNRGQAKFTLQLIPDALADYNKAIELDPKGAQPYFNRGTIKLFSLTNYTEAIADFTKAINLHSDPHEEDIYFWRGFARHKLKDYAGAIDDYKKSLQLNPSIDWDNAMMVRTNIDIALKQLQEFQKTIENFLRPFPKIACAEIFCY
jgi:tetratricopeptide (TPR) repeat protein